MENFFNQIKNIVLQSETSERIVILGKGGSIGNINKESLKKTLVININDSEKIFPGSFALFHSPWVYKSLKENGFKAGCYITNVPFISDEELTSIEVPYIPINYDGIERTLDLFKNDEFYLTDFLVISAIKLAIIIAKINNNTPEVFLLGFDFEMSDHTIISDFSGHEDEFKNVFLKTQRTYFEYFKKNFDKNNSLINLFHVGKQRFSDITIEGFNDVFGEFKSKGKDQFDNRRAYETLIRRAVDGHVLIVAEFTNNHIGDANRIKKMIQLAKEAGADLIKVQKRDVETFYTKAELERPFNSSFGKTLGDYRRGVELNDDLFELIINECRRNEIVWFASVLDSNSFEYIKAYSPPLIKLPSTISNHKNYLSKVASEYSGDLVISTGYTDINYEKFVLETFLKERNLFLLQTTSSYPAPPETCQISVVRHYDNLREMDQYNLFPGYSSHDLGSLGCMMSVAAGARMIEKHVKLGNIDWVHFDGVAIDLLNDEFKNFVKDIRKAEVMSGSKTKVIHEQEHHKYKPNNIHN
jgi:sialic acid synthase SpsE